MCMAVDRLSVTVPSELGAALRSLAEQRGETVSMIVTEAIAHRVRLAALDLALAEADRLHGAVSPDTIMIAERELRATRHVPAQKRPSRRRPGR